MKRILIIAAIIFLVCSMASAFQGGGGEATKKRSSNKETSRTKSDRNVAIAEPGFYITLFGCRACSRRQPDTMLSFRSRAFSAFYGNPVYDQAYRNIQFVEKLPGVYLVLVSLFVGPFQT